MADCYDPGSSSEIILGAVPLFWGDGAIPALTISFGIMVSVVITAIIGSTIPLILHARK